MNAVNSRNSLSGTPGFLRFLDIKTLKCTPLCNPRHTPADKTSEVETDISKTWTWLIVILLEKATMRSSDAPAGVRPTKDPDEF